MLWVASLLHDLGFIDRGATATAECFTLVGARAALARVLERYPRLDLKDYFPAVFEKEATLVPGSRTHFYTRLSAGGMPSGRVEPGCACGMGALRGEARRLHLMCTQE